MPKVDVIDLKNQVVGSIELSDVVFGAKINQALLYQAVHHYQAGQRAGTHKTKGRAEVSGSGRKPWRQKGTGRARIGSIRSPLWRSGGTVHGPQPRDYSYHLPKKMELGALRSALSSRLQDGALKVVKEFTLESHKSKEFRGILGLLDLDRSVLIVDNSDNPNLALSSRNLAGVTLMRSRDVHPYHLLGHRKVVFTESAAVHCSEVLS
ncbi:MAG: 50S ribosomal protein L4 [Acidobacteria bacterium]|nr:50S ribosomal protein L4 [Acidobacteriota bacterium]